MHTIRQRKRDSKIVYLCKSCSRYFSVDYSPSHLNTKLLLVEYLKGHSLRNLADRLGISYVTIYRQIKQELVKVPNSNHVTESVCDKYSGYLLVDAKYVSVRGHESKMAFIWAIDYYTHDIVWWMLTSTENSTAYMSLFRRLKSSNYSLKALVCDEHSSILTTVNFVFSDAQVQICTTHYLRNLRYKLNLKNSVDSYFFRDVKSLLTAKSMKIFNSRARMLVANYARYGYLLILIADLQNKETYLTTHTRHPKCPSTTNLIECYNKHLDVRLRKIDGFKSYASAELWLNAYVWLKRTSVLKCCKGKFKRLNGHMPLSFTAKDSLSRIYKLN
ncbi:MAG: transposase [Candidatus Doudnabacteria bacterium]|nr:transposase [Candidatus Doudnabacteria bacterium]